jgi:ABC-type dipeptide/oligopeptide/nickel transport system permease subunit
MKGQTGMVYILYTLFVSGLSVAIGVVIGYHYGYADGRRIREMHAASSDFLRREIARFGGRQ